MTVEPSAVAARVAAPSGLVVGIPEGGRLVFGRGPDSDLTIAAGRGLSRRAGVISAVGRGVDRQHQPDPRAVHRGGGVPDPAAPDGRAGGAVRGLVLARRHHPGGLPGHAGRGPAAAGDGHRACGWGDGPEGRSRSWQDGDATLLPLYLDPMTKIFLVALMWCRPWLLDPAGATPLPRTPEIAKAALEVTGAFHELERFDTDPAFRDRLSARVAEHIKVLRRKITDRGLVRADVRLSDEVVVRVLIEHGIITTADLGRLNDPAWCSRQEDLWWTQPP